MKMSRQVSIACAFALAGAGAQTVWAGQNDHGVTQQTQKFSADGSAFFISGQDAGMEVSVFNYKERARYSTATDAIEHQSVRFGFTDDSGKLPMHFSGAMGDGEYQTSVGSTLGDLTVSFTGGAGSSYSKLDHDAQGMNPHFFHGGADVDYRYNALEADYSLTDETSAGFGFAKVEALGVEDRNAYFVGMGNDKFYQRFSTYERGDDTAGYGLDMGTNLGRYSLDFQGLITKQDASMARLNFGVVGNKQNKFGLYLESAKNPLYAYGEEARMMFTYGGAWRNKAGVFNASDSEGKGHHRKDAKRYGFVGAGLAAAAILVSSGGDEKDRTKRFPNQNAAAFDAVNGINPKSVLENREYAGMIFRNVDGSYGATGPRAGKLASINPGNPSTVPVGTRGTAYYHTHSAEDDRFASERFSRADIAFAEGFMIDGYVGTPFGKLLRYNFRTNEVKRVGTVATPTTL